MKKIAKFLLIVGLLIITIKPVLATDKIILHFFWSASCPHCAKEKIFLSELDKKYTQLIIKDYEITANRENLVLLQEIGSQLKIDTSGVPFTIIGKNYFSGYLNDEITGTAIEKTVNKTIENNYEYEDIVSNLFFKQKFEKTEKQPEIIIEKQSDQSENILESITVPFLGNLEIKNLSLPVLTFIVALLDGFNPCAMWTLLFLISLLLGMKNRKRMWILGVTFIMTSALVYFLFLAAWLNLFMFLGFIVWVRIVISLVALGAGSYYLRDYWINKDGSCNVMGDKKRQKVFEKLKAITQKRQFIVAFGGIILLAIAVNLVELICSAGLPAIYTQILSLADLPSWQYYLYLTFYILIFMLDDLLVFLTAMITLQITGIQGKYTRYSHLIGGILMLIIGLLLLFKPEWLMFG